MDETAGQRIDAAAKQVLVETPPLLAWAEGKDEAIPARNLKPHLKRAAWPSKLVDGGESKVFVVPESWLRRLGELLGLPWERVSKGRVEVEE